MQRLPLVTLYLSERCNSRCVTCDYWRHGHTDMDLAAVRRLLPSLDRLATRVALISGGEPLLNTEWAEIAELLRSRGLRLWLLTSGLSLAKHARRVAELFDAVTVSLDGTNPATYTRIRGLDAFDKVCEGIRKAADAEAAVGLRVTVQRANYRELPRFIDLAHELGARQVSFLAVDVANPHAFGRRDDFTRGLSLAPDDLPEFEQLLRDLERRYVRDFCSAFIAESPAKLRRILQYFTAVCGRGEFPPVACNAPEFSAVITANGHVQPCFFIPGPAHASARDDLERVLAEPAMLALRQRIREGARAECATCVCSMWRDPGAFGETHFLRRPGAGVANMIPAVRSDLA